ncbi:MAG: HlyD family efflux transporter periplasmic adaptor subunit [Calditrichaeota bacterium]|nr:MAG: HlyD family efflux transporter periplasmic adaptor subunit [Calditrichota bacterium]
MKIKFICLILALGLTSLIFSENGHDDHEGHDHDNHSKNEESHDDHSGHGHDEHEEDLKLSPKIIGEIGLTVETVTKKNIGETVAAKGKIVTNPNNFAKIGSLISGRVAKIHSKLGDFVKKGDVLFEIESTEIVGVISDFISSKSELEVAKTNFERLQNLKKSEIGSAKNLLEAKAQFEIASAKFKAADLVIHTIGFTDKDLDEIFESDSHSKVLFKIRASITGEISFSDIKLGQFISEEVTVFEITNYSKIWVEVSLFEKDFGKVQNGNKVEVKLPMRNSILGGKIIRIGKTLSEIDRTIPLLVELEKPQGLIVNSFVEVNLFSNSKLTLAVPNQSLQFEGGENFVFVEEEPNKFERKAVFLGQKFDNYTEILSGLTENDKIVVEGSFYLKSKLAGENIGGHSH